MCRIVLYENNELKRKIAFECLQKYLYENSEGQLIIASTVKAPMDTFVESGNLLLLFIKIIGMLCGITLAQALFSFEKPRYHKLER